MKQITLTLLCTGIFFLSSCKDAVREEPPTETVTQVLRSADSAKADIAYFDTVSAMLVDQAGGSGTPIKAFTVRAVDLLAAMGMPAAEPPTLPYDHIRVYLGFNKSAGQFKLYIVPVAQASINNQQSGQDLMLDAHGNAVQPEQVYPPGYLSDKYVLDLNAPCPNLCDVQTPLTNSNQ